VAVEKKAAAFYVFFLRTCLKTGRLKRWGMAVLARGHESVFASMTSYVMIGEYVNVKIR
jgi:hypothetical protein